MIKRLFKDELDILFVGLIILVLCVTFGCKNTKESCNSYKIENLKK